MNFLFLNGYSGNWSVKVSIVPHNEFVPSIFDMLFNCSLQLWIILSFAS